MKNLAGNKDCDKYIRDELERANIEIVTVELDTQHHEVPFTLEGRLNKGKIKLWRAWYYWVAEGRIPYDIAQKIYAHPEGKKTVRAGGHCGCVDPSTQLTWISKESGKPAISQEKYDKQIKPMLETMPEIVEHFNEKNDVVDNVSKMCDPFVTCYHIDDQAGLLLYSMLTSEME